MNAADQIMADMQTRHAQRLGADVYAEFKRVFVDVVDQQRRDVNGAAFETSASTGTS